MPYGTEPFTDRYGDYKQPTVIDYDQQANKVVVNPLSESVDEVLEKHQKDMDSVLEEILSMNPFFAGTRYINFVFSNNGKLAWDTKKIDELKSNSDWLLTLRKYLVKAKKEFNLKNKP